jgi:hypothetical protein
LIVDAPQNAGSYDSQLTISTMAWPRQHPAAPWLLRLILSNSAAERIEVSANQSQQDGRNRIGMQVLN